MSIKLRAKESGGKVTIKCLMSHPMEGGLRKNKKTGELIPANFIKNVVGEHKGAKVMDCFWSAGISKNPYLSFKFTGGAKGDMIKVTWTDNSGKSESAEAKIA